MKKLLSTTAAAFFICANVHAAPMNLNVHNADLRSVIYMVARDGNLNVSVDDSVDGKISINLNGIEAEKALEIIAKTHNLNLIKDNGIYILTQNMNLVSPMKSYVLPIKFGDANQLRKAIFKTLDFEEEQAPEWKTLSLRNSEGAIRTYDYVSVVEEKNSPNSESNDDEKDPRAKRVIVNADTNSIILFGTEAEYERVKNLLENLDVELKQVSVEAQILAIDKNASKNLGVDWFWSTLPQYPQRDIEYTAPTYNSNGTERTPAYIEEEYTRKANDSTGYGIIQFGRGPEGIPQELTRSLLTARQKFYPAPTLQRFKGTRQLLTSAALYLCRALMFQIPLQLLLLNIMTRELF